MTKRIVIDAETRAQRARDLASRGRSGVTVGQLYDQLIGGWRTELLGAQEAALKGVTDSLAQTVATNSLGALSIATLPRIELPDFGRQIAKAIGQYQSGIGRTIADDLAAAIRPIALAATSGLLTAFQRSTEEERAAEEALWKMGWWMPQTVSMSFFARAGRLALAGKRLEVRRLMVQQLGRSRHIASLVDGWLELEPYRGRRRFLLDGLRDHRMGRYRVSIPTLLPLIEGIAVDAFTPGATHGPRPAFEAAALVDAATGPAMADTVTTLYTSHPFSAIASGSRQLNRHLILHGRSTGYGTEENSVKVLLALDTLAFFIEERDRAPRKE